MNSQLNSIPKGEDVKAFVTGNINYFNRKKDTPQHIKEQILYRMLKCAPCVISSTKKCAHCGCPTPKLFFAPNKQDSKNNWPPFFHDKAEGAVTKATLSPSIQELQSQHPQVFSLGNNLGI